MRYTPDHKQQTRRRIIACAARRFRHEGYGSASVADIMSDAGLTHGGFYAHFGSKEELLAEAIAHAADEGLTARTPVGERRGHEWLGAFVSLYLNEEHWGDRAGGCPLAALGGEVARGGDLPRASYGAAVAAFADALAARLDGPEAAAGRHSPSRHVDVRGSAGARSRRPGSPSSPNPVCGVPPHRGAARRSLISAGRRRASMGFNPDQVSGAEARSLCESESIGCLRASGGWRPSRSERERSSWTRARGPQRSVRLLRHPGAVSQAAGAIASPDVTARVIARRWVAKEAPMKVFVAGATGAIGTQLVGQLAATGHDVIGMTRSPTRSDMLRALGARPVVAEALDPDAVARAVAETEPEVIVHQLTALKGEPGLRDMRHPDRLAAMTNRLRTEGIDHLLAAGRAVGIRRFIAQSVVAIGTYARTGGPVKTEDDPLDADLPVKGRSGADALRYLEDAVTGIDWADGVVLRYGAFYGPGTGISSDPAALLTKAIRKRRFPIIGDGGGVWSFVHIEDAASATVAAVDRAGPASTTSSTTSRRRCASGCRSWPSSWVRRSRGGPLASWSGCSPARSRC